MSQLTIHAYLFCHNNATIIPFIMDYWKKVASRVIVYDNMSDDGSIDLLKQYSWVEIRQFDTRGSYSLESIQNLKMQCYKECRKKDVDYVFVCDITDVPLYGDYLLNYIKQEKFKGTQYFVSDVYHLVCENTPVYNRILLQNYKDIRYLSFENKCVMAFSPYLDIDFDIQGDSQIYDDNHLYAPLTMLTADIVGEKDFYQAQFFRLKNVYDLEKVDYKTKLYGISDEECQDKFNTFVLESLKNKIPIIDLLRPISTSDFLYNYMKIIEVTEKNQTIKNNLSAQTTQSSVWSNNTHLDRYMKKTNSCIVLIPIPNNELTDKQITNIKHLVELLGKSYELFLLGSTDRNFTKIVSQTNHNFSILRCNSYFFSSDAINEELFMLKEFYTLITRYKYVFIYDVNAWLFRDDIEHLITLNYDYISSPYLDSDNNERIGDGKISFRKVSKFMEIAGQHKNDGNDEIYNTNNNLYISKYIIERYHLNTAPIQVACNFSLYQTQDYWIDKFNCNPMCAADYDVSFWLDYDSKKRITKIQKKQEIVESQTQLSHYYRKTNKCVIVVPIHNGDLTFNETRSLRHLIELTSQNYEIVLLGSSDRDYNKIVNELNYNFSVLRCNSKFFTNNSVSENLFSMKEVYNSFSIYEYMLIYDLKGWIFENKIGYFLSLGVDYIASPYKVMDESMCVTEYIGGGSISLRKTSKFIELISKITEEDKRNQYYNTNNNQFVSEYLNNKYRVLNVCTIRQSCEFAINVQPEYWFSKTNQIPMCVCDYDNDYWQERIENIKRDKKQRVKEVQNVGIPEKVVVRHEMKKCAYMENEITGVFNANILICIFNYRHDENAKRWSNLLSPYFKTVVLDSGNDHIEKDFIQFPNIYYSGLWNEMKKLSEQGDYSWVGIITSDVVIDNENAKRLIERIKWLTITNNIGVWQPSADKSAKSCYGYNDGTHRMEYMNLLEGWFLMIKNIVFDTLPYIDLNVNKYGWQIDNMICTISKQKYNLLNIKDNGIIVYHPKDSGYNQDEARKQGRDYCQMIEKLFNFHINGYKDKIEEIPIEYINWYQMDKIKYDIKTDRTNPIIVSLTSWKQRIQYVPEALIHIKEQTLKPDKIIVWLSTDEMTSEDIPQSLLSDKDIEVKYTDKDTKVWKRYLTIQQFPNAFVVMIDDDFCYPNDYIEKLYKCANEHNNYGIISYGSLYCTECGTPYSRNAKVVTPKRPWISGGITMWCPNTFPVEAFYYYKDVMYGRAFQCDETYLMTFINYFNIPIYNIVDNRDKFLCSMKTIGFDINKAMSTMALKSDKHGKYILLYDILNNYLPKCYYDDFKQKFPSFGNDLSDDVISTNRFILKTQMKCIYTCITNDYDTLKEPKIISNGFDYICFTDNVDKLKRQNPKTIWKIVDMPIYTQSLPVNKKQRYVKIMPHIMFSQYEISVWVDGSIQILDDINELVDNYTKDKNHFIIIPKHPVRDCIYQEITVCAQIHKDTIENMQPQIDKYKKEGFPTHFGLCQSNIIIRRHNDERCISFMEDWWNELYNGSHRDQLSFNYVEWKHNIKCVYLDKYIYKSKYFNWTTHTKQNKK